MKAAQLLLTLIGASTATAYLSSSLLPGCSAVSRCVSSGFKLRCGARLLRSHRSLDFRAKAEQNPGDSETSKKLAAAWIANDKAKELKDLLGGSSLYLVGLPGSGNDNIAAMLAKRMDVYSFLDLKEVMAAAVGKSECGSYLELMDTIGVEDFRDLEGKVLDQVQAVLRLVVSTDAGVVTDVSNWARMQNGLVIYVESDLELLAKKSGLSTEKLGAMKEEFGEFYKLADVKVTVDAEDVVDTAAVKVIDSLMDLIKNNPPKRKEWQIEHDKRVAELDEKERKKGMPGPGPGKGFQPKSGNI